jgi:hypothetical protein
MRPLWKVNKLNEGRTRMYVRSTVWLSSWAGGAMNLREEIRALYHENRNIGSKEILERLGCKPTQTFWRILNDEQVSMRGVYPARRKNRNMPHSHAKGFRRGAIYWIPPKQKGE